MTKSPKLSPHLLSVAFAIVYVGAVGLQSAKECQEGSPMGASYLGKKNVTTSGLICQSWSSSKPHEHQYDEVGDHNFCRNPDSSWDGGVWCYTTDPKKRWEVCSVPVCAAKHNCRQAGDPLGAEYSGDTSVTASGLTCQAWSASEPHKHGFTEVGDHNHCRNPDGFSGGLWCYTTDPEKEWEHCSVPICVQTIMKVLDFSADNDQELDSNAAFTGATLDTGVALPESITVCSAFMVDAWIKHKDAPMFLLLDDDPSENVVVSVSTPAVWRLKLSINFCWSFHNRHVMSLLKNITREQFQRLLTYSHHANINHLYMGQFCRAVILAVSHYFFFNLKKIWVMGGNDENDHFTNKNRVAETFF